MDRSKWDQFYEENASKLAMPSDINYPLQRAALQTWADMQPTEKDYRQFAQLLAHDLVYVSWAEFRNALRACIDELVRTEKQPYAILLTGDESEPLVEVGKSQVWVALLAYGMLKQRGVAISAILSTRADLIAWAATQENPTALVFDDGAYTGNQLSTALAKCFEGGATGNLPQQTRYISLVLMVPFMTRIARALITSSYARWERLVLSDSVAAGGRLVFLNATRTIPVARFEGKDYALIYFDHKLADQISVGSLGMAAPVIQGNQNACTPFIGNCGETQCRNVSIFDAFSLRYKGPGAVKRCPPPFYKSIRWTFQGKPVSIDDHLAEVLPTAARVGLTLTKGYPCVRCSKALFSPPTWIQGIMARHCTSDQYYIYCSQECVDKHCPCP